MTEYLGRKYVEYTLNQDAENGSVPQEAVKGRALSHSVGYESRITDHSTFKTDYAQTRRAVRQSWEVRMV